MPDHPHCLPLHHCEDDIFLMTSSQVPPGCYLVPPKLYFLPAPSALPCRASAPALWWTYLVYHHLSSTERTQNGSQDSEWPNELSAEEHNHFPWPLAVPLLVQPRMVLAPSAARAQGCPVLTMLPAGSPGAGSAQLFSCLDWWQRALPSQVMHVALSLLNSLRSQLLIPPACLGPSAS